MTYIKTSIFHFFLLLSVVARAQDPEIYPLRYQMVSAVTHYIDEYLTPPSESRLSSSVYHNQRTGLFKEVQSTTLNASYSADNTRWGINAVSNRKGDFIRKDRAYICYSNHIQLDKERFLAAGMQLGMVMYSIAGNTSGPSGADTKPDATVGLNYYTSKFAVGISVNQLPKSTLNPIYESITLKRYAAGNISRKYTISNEWSGNTAVRLEVYTDDITILSIQSKCEYMQKVSGAGSFNTEGELLVAVGVKYTTLSLHRFELLFGYLYQTSLLDQRHPTSAVQLGFRFFGKSVNQ